MIIRYLGLLPLLAYLTILGVVAPSATLAQPFSGKQLVKVPTYIDETRYVSHAMPTKNFIILKTSAPRDPFASGFSLFYTTGTANSLAPLIPARSGIVKLYRYSIKPNSDTVYFSGERRRALQGQRR